MGKELYTITSLQKRLLCILGIITFLFLVVIGKLFVVQIIQGEKLQIRAIEQWTRDLPMVGLRGEILDTNNVPLATSYTSYNVYLRASNVTQPVEVAKLLSQSLNCDYQQVYDKAITKNVSESLVKQQVDIETAHYILSQNLNGIYLAESSSRYYEYNDLLTQVLGFTTIDNQGQSGLENYYNNFLVGSDGYAMNESTITGLELHNSTTSYLAGSPGCSINLTIDVNIQQVMENVLTKAVKEQQAKGATAIMMDPRNGEILAMVSKPSFDLNNPPRDNVQQLLEYSKNVNITDVYEPGSTFKIFTMAAALSSGVTNVNEKFYDPGYRVIDGQRIKCWRTKGHGSETLVEGFCNSCNSVFMDLGLRMGKDSFYEYLNKFGIGSKTGVDFFGESAGIMMNKDFVKNVDLARISFGQAIATTPLQMITGVCGILNGTLYQPHFVKSITANNGSTKLFSATPIRKVVNSEVSKTILMMMEEVVSTKGLYSFVPGYRIGGKTGTAQKYENGTIADGKYVSSFVGCFPVENPEYVMMLCIDEPSAGAYYGSVVASPYAKEVFSGLFNYLNIAPTNLVEDLQKLELKITVPNLVGMSITQAVALLKSIKLEYEIDGDGGRVSWQNIVEGEQLFVGGIVVLKT